MIIISVLLHKYVEDIDITIKRYCFLKETINNEEKDKLDELIDTLVRHKTLLQRAIKGGFFNE